MRYLTILMLYYCFSCDSTNKNNDQCNYTLKSYLSADSIGTYSNIYVYNNIEQIVDERINSKYGGVYSFDMLGNFLAYRYYKDTQLFTYEENFKDSIYYSGSPLIKYEVLKDDSNYSHLIVLFFLLNKELDNLMILKDGKKQKDLSIEKHERFSHTYITNLLLKNYSIEEIKRMNLSIEGDIKYCNGKKIHFKEPLIWNREEAEKYAKQQNKLSSP